MPRRPPESPTGPADGIEPAGRHIDRAEAAMGGVIGGAELGRPPAGQGLALVAAGEEGELLRIGCADIAEPFGGKAQSLRPLDLLELAGPAFAQAQQGV